MKYTESDKDAIEAILYYQYRIDKATKELLQRHTVRAVYGEVNNEMEQIQRRSSKKPI